MAHLIIDYSPNVEHWLDMPALCDALRVAMIETGALPLPGIRVRAHRADHVSIADGADHHGFIDMSLRLRGGRDIDTKRAATNHIFEAARRFVEPVMATRSLALSFEMRDIDPDLSPKTGTIRDHLET
ncbi:5-carboxymethyl-2-hydroxymuconate Delta-isomerase [Falsiphaeobacter marinintestinus]|uniref:5-carboxymethyl-2-hydroxymuconate Delta-isomerase n=1 Tax=Falsiphaeobacter marinintestinus TaxID=1492905 RepID=UPI0011B6EAD2|nr:5-carboxymethyl-2-hydroxymuconate Delta-isomerase [Phaeobacter marinintestinus]